MDRGAWSATVHGVARVQYHLLTKQQYTHTHTHTPLYIYIYKMCVCIYIYIYMSHCTIIYIEFQGFYMHMLKTVRVRVEIQV